MTDFAKLLNPERFAAVTAGDGPLLVLAAEFTDILAAKHHVTSGIGVFGRILTKDTLAK